MIEILNILFQVFFLFVLNFFPKQFFFTKNSYTKNVHIFSNIFILITLLFLSFIDLRIKFVLIILYFIFFVNLFFIFKNKSLNLLIFNNNWLVFIVVIVLSISLSVNLKLGWDVQNFWIQKYLNFKNELGLNNLGNLARSEYPYLGTYIWAIFSETSFFKFEYLGRIYFIYIFCISLKRLVDFTDYDESDKSLLFIIILFLIYNLNLISGYQEILVFSYLIFLSTYMYYLLLNKFDKNFFLLCILTTYILFWIKNEAMIFASILFFSMSIYLTKQRLLIIGTILILLFLRYASYEYLDLKANLQAGNYDKINLYSISELFQFERIFLILKYLIFAHFKNLISILTLFTLVFIILKKYINKREYKYFIIVILFNYLFIFSAYLISFYPLEFHLKTSVDRLLFQSLGSYLILSFILMKKKF